MILLIDNYDSFTFNVYQAVAQLGYPVKVIRNDQTSCEEVAAARYDAIIISPGPGTPDDAGISRAIVRQLAGKLPILGICLGHQVIGDVFGGKVMRAPQPVHGKVARINHDGQGIYAKIPQPFVAGRYHSLIVDRPSLPDCLTVTATTEDGLIMGLRHNRYAVEGIQFHPESILTPDGSKILQNFLTGIGKH